MIPISDIITQNPSLEKQRFVIKFYVVLSPIKLILLLLFDSSDLIFLALGTSEWIVNGEYCAEHQTCSAKCGLEEKYRICDETVLFASGQCKVMYYTSDDSFTRY